VCLLYFKLFIFLLTSTFSWESFLSENIYSHFIHEQNRSQKIFAIAKILSLCVSSIKRGIEKWLIDKKRTAIFGIGVKIVRIILRQIMKKELQSRTVETSVPNVYQKKKEKSAKNRI